MHNHYELHIQYHEHDIGVFRVVGAYVIPYSFADPLGAKCIVDGTTPRKFLDEKKDNEVTYTYSVFWEVIGMFPTKELF